MKISTYWPIAGFLFFGFLTGCEHHDEIPVRDSRDLCYGDGNCFAEFQENKKIEFAKHNDMQYLVVSDGDNTVFEYRFEPSAVPGRQDGIGSQSIYIQVDAKATSFEYSTLPGQTAYYAESCGECSGPLASEIGRGTIKATRLSEATWHIQADLWRFPNYDSPPTGEIIVDAIFTKK